MVKTRKSLFVALNNPLMVLFRLKDILCRVASTKEREIGEIIGSKGGVFKRRVNVER